MISEYISKNARVTAKHNFSKIKWIMEYSEIKCEQD